MVTSCKTALNSKDLKKLKSLVDCIQVANIITCIQSTLEFMYDFPVCLKY